MGWACFKEPCVCVEVYTLSSSGVQNFDKNSVQFSGEEAIALLSYFLGVTQGAVLKAEETCFFQLNCELYFSDIYTVRDSSRDSVR